MKIITWNVSGLRACLDHGLLDYLTKAAADIVALQETKVTEPLPELAMPGYSAFWNGGERLGYSGTVCMFKNECKPLKMWKGGNDNHLNKEGRVITLEYPDFYFVNVYVPNSQGGLNRWYYRLDFDAAFVNYLDELNQEKMVIVAGDFNVARDYIDIFPENLRNEEHPAGFTSEERDGFLSLLDVGLADVFRELHPLQDRAYTWWSNRLNKRRENRGWRIDYFLVSKKLLPKVKKCEIRVDVRGSDHAPMELTVKV